MSSSPESSEEESLFSTDLRLEDVYYGIFIVRIDDFTELLRLAALLETPHVCPRLVSASGTRCRSRGSTAAAIFSELFMPKGSEYIHQKREILSMFSRYHGTPVACAVKLVPSVVN